MRKEPNKKIIGLFILIGVIVFFGIVLKIAGDKIFPDDKDSIVMYFDESIKGLSVGSSVVFKGVEVGKVIQIELVINHDRTGFSIPVYVKMNDHQGLTPLKESYAERKRLLALYIEEGLRARLIAQNYLTSQLMIELEILPATPVVFRYNGKDKEMLEIPTVLSAMGELSRSE
ncbi:MAG: MlaD family protein, partial [Lactobacillales bacterium]|nr:MlaD family protein [Lactobacillales bacterium]